MKLFKFVSRGLLFLTLATSVLLAQGTASKPSQSWKDHYDGAHRRAPAPAKPQTARRLTSTARLRTNSMRSQVSARSIRKKSLMAGPTIRNGTY